MTQSTIYLNKEKMFDSKENRTINGKLLYHAPITLSSDDESFSEDILERRIINALAKNDRTYYHIIWDQRKVFYVKT